MTPGPLPSPRDLIALAERLNSRGPRALGALSAAEISVAWHGAVEAFLDPAAPERRAIEHDFERAVRLSPQGLQAGLEAVLGGVRGEAAARLFEAAEARRGRAAPKAPRGDTADGFVLVILASNLPALGVQPLLPALAARRPVLLKCPSAEPVFTPAFVEALRARLPGLADGVAVATWRGGDASREDPLLARAGVVLAYGDQEAVASLERRAPPGRVVAYGPRASLAVLGAGADVEEAATDLARDVALFDQRGCLSVAAVYVAGGPERARTTAVALAAALRRLARLWPPGPAVPAEAAAVRQLRTLAEMRGVPAWRVGDTLGAGTVLLEPQPGFQPVPGLRTVRVHPLSDLGRLPEILAPWRHRLQGVALAGVSKERAGTLVPALARLGVSRFAAPGELQHPDTAWHNGGVNPIEILLPG